jgi:hypothetical protein
MSCEEVKFRIPPYGDDSQLIPPSMQTTFPPLHVSKKMKTKRLISSDICRLLNLSNRGSIQKDPPRLVDLFASPLSGIEQDELFRIRIYDGLTN